MYFEKVRVTPAVAEKLLETNLGNRDVRWRHVENLKQEILSGRWKESPQPIAVGKDKVLKDGQHRCWAVIEANTPIISWIAYDVDNDVMPVLDTGIVRVAKDILKWHDKSITNPLQFGGALRAAFIGADGTIRKIPNTSIAALSDLFKSHITFSCSVIASGKHGVRRAAVLGAIARADIFGVDRAILERLGAILSTGIAQRDEDSTVIKLRDYLISGLGNSGGSAQKEVYLKTERTIKALRDGEHLRNIYAPSEELFPYPDAFARKLKSIK